MQCTSPSDSPNILLLLRPNGHRWFGQAVQEQVTDVPQKAFIESTSTVLAQALQRFTKPTCSRCGHSCEGLSQGSYLGRRRWQKEERRRQLRTVSLLVSANILIQEHVSSCTQENEPGRTPCHLPAGTAPVVAPPTARFVNSRPKALAATSDQLIPFVKCPL